MAITHTLTLTIDVSPGTDPEDVITDINAAVLCRMEEDTRQIVGWHWDTKSTIIHTPRED